MTNNSIHGSAPSHSTEWKLAWDAVAHLAATRQDVLRGARHDDPPLAPIDAANAPAEALAPVEAEEYARAIAEIEQASEALRRAEPALEAWRPASAAASEKRKSRSVWILVSGIWISTVTVFAGAIGAILYLLG
jgi:hypothetical protein